MFTVFIQLVPELIGISFMRLAHNSLSMELFALPLGAFTNVSAAENVEFLDDGLLSAVPMSLQEPIDRVLKEPKPSER